MKLDYWQENIFIKKAHECLGRSHPPVTRYISSTYNL